jgi:hypothetical protein
MLKASAKLTAATAFLTLAALGAFALPTDGARLAGASLSKPTGIEQVQYWRRSRCFRQCIAGKRFRSCQNDVQGNKENCCSERCRPRW